MKWPCFPAEGGWARNVQKLFGITVIHGFVAFGQQMQVLDPIGNRTTCATLQARPTQEAPMISHAKISRHRRMFKTLTGLSTEGFNQILPVDIGMI